MEDRRTPLARARGLGSARDGLHHWWVQRLTAVALIPLVAWFAVSLVMLSGADHMAVRAWIGSPVVMVLLILTIVIGLHHGQLGMQVVVEDYVHGDGWKLALIVAIRFIAFFFGLAGGRHPAHRVRRLTWPRQAARATARAPARSPSAATPTRSSITNTTSSWWAPAAPVCGRPWA
ncbi:succinate dehydrogenase, hydrophobic membrane anchor protein [Reyranella sp.]|uniref:succinate dehydrogenase, hydrophobic membrane anchor protein n=1 Tax=Reyranella sp. TaxID=1929291 RepID=UPI003783787D